MVKKMSYVILAMGLPLFFLAGLSAKQEIGEEELKQFYGSIIDEMSAKCKYKSHMRDSRCGKIKNASTLSCLKNKYWSNNKESLVEEMCKKDLGLDRNRALVFLNQRFHRIAKERGLNLHSQTPLAALPEKPVDKFEKMTVKEFCCYYCLPADLVLSALGENGLTAETEKEISIEQIAENESMSAEEIYRMVRRR